MRGVSEAVVPTAEVSSLLEPRQGWIQEQAAAEPGEFTADAPFRSYRRRVTVTDQGDGTALVRNEVEFELAIPIWGWLFAGPMLLNLKPVRWNKPWPWFLPPAAMDTEAAAALASLSLFAAATGYSAVLLSQTLTFAADEFGSTAGQQSLALSIVRVDFLIGLLLVVAADRKGRRWALTTAAVLTCVFSAAGALSPSLWALAATQIGARGALTAAGVITGIVAAEEMPAGARSFAVGLLTLAGGLGAGLPILLLFVADLDVRGWRVLFALAVLGLPLIHLARQDLPESKRFRAPHPDAPVIRRHSGRFWMLAATGILFAIFFTPASQFTNEYLREERGFAAGQITLFTILTNLPGFFGILIGGRLAERGRKLIGAASVVGGVGATVAMFLATGWPIWAWSVVGALVGTASIPALGVYGPELFPTSSRGTANGLLTALGRIGSIIGLVAFAFLVDRLGSFGPALAILAIGPVIVAVVIVLFYPETAHIELEDLNPEDRTIEA